ncbi:hypothetical protein [Endozoicomonas sp.]|uniref:hypothetical protein n=1 Tax=Endozoicomonas sp. TaxID=1892382 RepID=UPI002883850C|nr:hypothetical protein [Endozoicomonas sp.]
MAIPHFLFSLVLVLFLTPSLSRATYYHDDVPPFPPWHGGTHLGQMYMPVTSQNEMANEHFQTAVKLLHTYAFPEALWSLREAQRLDPGFAMAYWGEIIAGNKLIWNSFDHKLAQSAIKQMDQNVDYGQLSPLERGYIKAARQLASPNPKNLKPYETGSPIWQFRLAMADLYRQFPDNPDVKVLYGYSVLGTRRGIRDFITNNEAITLFREVLTNNPEHPGALHYLLHGTENPVQSYLARSAAKSFSGIAADSIHARHMPSHYYITLGDWAKIIEVNQKAVAASIKRAKELNLSDATLEYHGYSWIVYSLLQQGKTEEAFKGFKWLENLFRTNHSSTAQKYLLLTRARFLVDSGSSSRENRAVRATTISHDNAFCGAVAMDTFASGYDGWKRHDIGQLEQALTRYQQFMKNDLSGLTPPEQDAVVIMEQQMLAMSKAEKGNLKQAEDHFNHAARLEDRMVYEHGPPITGKPSSELYADFLLKQKRFGEALYFYNKASNYHPGRRQIILGTKKAMENLQATGA